MQQPLLGFEIENFLLVTDNVWDDICTLTVTGPRRRDHKISDTNVQTWEEWGRQKPGWWHSGAPRSSHSCPQICHPWSGPIIRLTSANQRRAASQPTNQRQEARVQYLFVTIRDLFSWMFTPRQHWELTHSAMNGVCVLSEAKDWGYLYLRVRHVPISRVSAVSPDPCCDVNIYREWHKTSWSALRQWEAMIVWGWPMRGPGVWVTVRGTGHCPPVTRPPAPALINREMPLSGQQRWHCILANQRLDTQLLANQRRVWVITSLGPCGDTRLRDRGMSRVTCHVLSHSDQVRFAENIVLHF